MLKITVTVLVILLVQHVLMEEIVEAATENDVYDSYRLPTAITPENYKLEVITDLNDTEGFLFRGAVWITVSGKNESAYLRVMSRLALFQINNSIFALNFLAFDFMQEKVSTFVDTL